MTNQFSILDYYTDNSMYINKHKCADFTPPFISYLPIGINPKNIQLESDLKGITRLNSNCAEKKYVPKNLELATQLNNCYITKNTKTCKPKYKILPNGYINSKQLK